MSLSLKLVIEKIQRINELIDASLMERIASSLHWISLLPQLLLQLMSQLLLSTLPPY